MIHRPIHANYDGRGKQADSIPGLMQIQAGCVEGTAHVDPVRWSNHPFVAESENLPANNDVRPAFLRTAHLDISLADIPDVLIGHCIGDVLIEKGARVLRLAEESEPSHRLNRKVKPETG